MMQINVSTVVSILYYCIIWIFKDMTQITESDQSEKGYFSALASFPHVFRILEIVMHTKTAQSFAFQLFFLEFIERDKPR